MQARNAIVVLLDSLNRHLLGAYGSTEFETPSLEMMIPRKDSHRSPWVKIPSLNEKCRHDQRRPTASRPGLMEHSAS